MTTPDCGVYCSIIITVLLLVLTPPLGLLNKGMYYSDGTWDFSTGCTPHLKSSYYGHCPDYISQCGTHSVWSCMSLGVEMLGMFFIVALLVAVVHFVRIALHNLSEEVKKS